MLKSIISTVICSFFYSRSEKRVVNKFDMCICASKLTNGRAVFDLVLLEILAMFHKNPEK